MNWIKTFSILGIILAISMGVSVSFRVASYMCESEDRKDAAPERGRYITVGDSEIFIQEEGSPANPLVLFTHGTGAWSEIWRPTLEELAKEGYYTVAIDLPPFGYSVPPVEGNYAKAEQGRRINSLLRKLTNHPATIVGHSFGSGPAMEAYFSNPARYDKIVLVSAALGLVDESEERSAITLPSWLLETVTSMTLTNPLLTKFFLGQLVADPSKIDDADVQMIKTPLAVRGASKEISRWLPILLRNDLVAMSSHLEQYRQISIPTILIWGDKDTTTPLQVATDLVQKIPDARLYVLEGIGHIPHLEDEATFNRTLIQALQDAT